MLFEPGSDDRQSDAGLANSIGEYDTIVVDDEELAEDNPQPPTPRPQPATANTFPDPMERDDEQMADDDEADVSIAFY